MPIGRCAPRSPRWHRDARRRDDGRADHPAARSSPTSCPSSGREPTSIQIIGRSPGRLTLLFGGSAVITLAYLGAMVASLEAFGADVSFPTIGLLFLTASAVANVAPTPGGLGRGRGGARCGVHDRGGSKRRRPGRVPLSVRHVLAADPARLGRVGMAPPHRQHLTAGRTAALGSDAAAGSRPAPARPCAPGAAQQERPAGRTRGRAGRPGAARGAAQRHGNSGERAAGPHRGRAGTAARTMARAATGSC